MKNKRIIILTGIMLTLSLSIVISIFLKLYSITLLLLLLLIIIRLSITTHINKQTSSQERKIKKYTKIKKIGCIPFILVLTIGIINMFIGTDILSLFGGRSYGLAALFVTVLYISYYIWPTYIIGIILIIISNKKIEQIDYQNEKNNK